MPIEEGASVQVPTFKEPTSSVSARQLPPGPEPFRIVAGGSQEASDESGESGELVSAADLEEEA